MTRMLLQMFRILIPYQTRTTNVVCCEVAILAFQRRASNPPTVATTNRLD